MTPLPPSKRATERGGQQAFKLSEQAIRPDPSRFIRAGIHEPLLEIAQRWEKSGERILVICGEAKSGKTLFATAFVPGAPIVRASDYQFEPGARHPDMTIIDQAELLEPDALFHLLDVAFGPRLVLVGRGAPLDWSRGSPSLATRLEALPRLVIGDPDEDLMRAVIARGFRDRQIDVHDSVAAYAAPRLPRTFAAAHKFIDEADRLSLELKRKITVALVQPLVDNLSEGVDRA